MTKKEIRNTLRNAFGPRQYRITAKGEIHVCGTMPNTNETGWYLFGWVGNTETEAHIKSL